MEKKLARYLRPHRQRWRLTQGEVARLLGYADSSLASRIESGIRNPSLLDAFALQVVFGPTPMELFPALFDDAEEAVLRRAKEMYEELQDVPSKAAVKKLELLDEVIKRAISRLPPEQ
jgi:transcriptional regulator with XRE-family HTH domain